MSMDIEKAIEELWKSGTIWIEGVEVVGRAADGVIVSLGWTGDMEGVNNYLRHYPAPAEW